jgi:DNA-binding CsgD family transcriptional regulator
MNEGPILLENGNESSVSECAYDKYALATLVTDTLLENTIVFNTDNGIILTKREKEILRLIGAGQTNKQIARHLSRSERTVEFHRNRLMRKMSAHNAAELVRKAIVLGVI